MDLSSIVVTAIVSAIFSVFTSYIMFYIKEKKNNLAVSKIFPWSRLKDLRPHNLCSNVKG